MGFSWQPFYSIDSGVKWPECSSYKPEFGPGGEIVVRSEEGRAVLTLSPSGEEFSVEFACNLSQPQHQIVCSLNKTDGSLKSQQQANSQNDQRHLGKESTKSNSFSSHLTSTTQQQVLPFEYYCALNSCLIRLSLFNFSSAFSLNRCTRPPQLYSITLALPLIPHGPILSPWLGITGRPVSLTVKILNLKNQVNPDKLMMRLTYLTKMIKTETPSFPRLFLLHVRHLTGTGLWIKYFGR